MPQAKASIADVARRTRERQAELRPGAATGSPHPWRSQLRTIVARLGSQRRAAELLGASPAAVSRYAAGQRPGPTACLAIAELYQTLLTSETDWAMQVAISARQTLTEARRSLTAEHMALVVDRGLRELDALLEARP